MNFDEIDDVLPFMETALEKNLDLNAEQKANPRLFKTHHPSSHCPKNCKNIVVLRNPLSVVYSHFKFVQYYHVIPPTVTLDDFVKGSWLGHPDTPNSLWPLHVSYFTHLLGWYKYRNDSSTLIVFFEEMKEDLEKVVRVIAAFIGIEDEEKIQAALSMSSFSFMKKNNAKFDFSAPTLPKKPGEAMFIRTGTVDEGPKNLPNESKAAIQEKWKETVAKVTGCETYEELRRCLREERPL